MIGQTFAAPLSPNGNFAAPEKTDRDGAAPVSDQI
jgi:hypothetical protein